MMSVFQLNRFCKPKTLCTIISKSISKSTMVSTKKTVPIQIKKFINKNPDEMRLIFAAANRTFYDEKVVAQVNVNTFSGAFGILPNHVPTLAVLKAGVCTVFETNGKQTNIFVSSGTVNVNADSTVVILAEEAHEIQNLNPDACKDILRKALDDLSSATTDIERAKAEIAVEVAEELVRATL